MPTKSYRIARKEAGWSVFEGTTEGMTYATQEAALEAATAAASGDLRTGHSIRIEAAPPTDPDGSRESGGSPIAGDGFT